MSDPDLSPEQQKEVDKLLKRYKKLKKLQKSNFFTIQKLSGKRTKIDEVLDADQTMEGMEVCTGFVL